eukprot:27736-Pyramimonas_sp.AAC.1
MSSPQVRECLSPPQRSSVSSSSATSPRSAAWPRGSGPRLIRSLWCLWRFNLSVVAMMSDYSAQSQPPIAAAVDLMDDPNVDPFDCDSDDFGPTAPGLPFVSQRGVGLILVDGVGLIAC